MKGSAIPYSQEEMQWLHDNHKLMISDYHQQFCDKFNRTDVSKANLNSLRKRKGWRTGRTGHFHKGQTSWNKGTKGLTSTNKTSFKKGHKPHNHKPVGHQRITKDGYIEIKTAEPKTFELLHRLEWQKHHGPIPKDMIVTFKDGNTLNCNINNLELISRLEHVRRNKLQINKAPAQIKPTLKLIAKLQTQTTLKKREQA
ncbi:HNH endonuclease [uncultured Thiomicrorhabdus sp.]